MFFGEVAAEVSAIWSGVDGTDDKFPVNVVNHLNNHG